ncbi:MAG TPA: 8-amino-7-oxononanoate synthase [Thermoleophilaceae bacterium]|jgi:glycine C-acetyltransferase/8-amino-7-oxononanoate synthase
MTDIEAALDELRERGLHRRMRLVSGPQGARVLLDGKPVLLLSSNNYLGLADHPRVREAAAEAAMRWGAGAGASRLISGNMTCHRRLEERLAAFKGYEAAVLFGSGYLANSGVISALAREGEVVFSDELNHASIVDGCRLAKADTFVYDHCDTDHLEWGLQEAAGRGALIVTDSVFSMDGDIAPLEEIVELGERYDARVMVDEAHGTGCLGPGGRGAVADAGLEDEVDILVGTLGKALGSYGAYVCCEREMADFLVNRARTLIFSTALPPPAVAGAMAALDLLIEQPDRARKLQRNARVMRDALAEQGVRPGESETQIVPLVVGDAGAAMDACEHALERGVFAQAIRPPTVPEGTSRLRLAVMAAHTEAELRRAASVLASALRAGATPLAAPAHRPSGDSMWEWGTGPRQAARAAAAAGSTAAGAAGAAGATGAAGKVFDGFADAA